jgi:rod shape-determining protein MreC
MLRSQDRSYTRLDTWLLVGSLGLSVVLYFLPPAWGLAAAAGLRDTVLLPLVWLQERAEEGRTSRARFEAVTAERDSAAYAAQFLPALKAENVRLRQMLGLSRRIATPFVPAEVLHQSQATDGRVLLLNVGGAQGVAAFDPVVTPEGLVGVVWSVTERSSVVMTWAHPEFRVSAVTETGGSFGLVVPAGSATAVEASLELRGVPYRDSIPVGTRVLSSGLGGVYPRGIPIGAVAGVSSEQRGWERVYRLRPAASPSAASHVLVLVAPRDSSVVEAFPSDSILDALAADSAARVAREDSLLRVRLADSVRAVLRDSTQRAAAGLPALPPPGAAAGAATAPAATPRQPAGGGAAPRRAAPARPIVPQILPGVPTPAPSRARPARTDTTARARRDTTP